MDRNTRRRLERRVAKLTDEELRLSAQEKTERLAADLGVTVVDMVWAVMNEHTRRAGKP